MKPEIILHLGVHKTATTHIQSRLWNSREKLLSHGIQYIGLNELREIMTSKLGGGRSASEIVTALAPFMDAEKLVISDENILGGTDMPGSKKLYSSAKDRLSVLVGALNQYKITAHITLRDYADYLISRYCESLRHYKYRSFSTYYKNTDFAAVSWLDLLDDIRAAGCNNLIVSDFNYAIRNNDEYLSRMLGVDFQLDDATDSASTRRSKMSLETIRILNALNKHYPVPLVKKIMNMLDNHKQISPVTPFNPFDEDVLERLKANYSEHMQVLNSGNRDIQMWS